MNKQFLIARLKERSTWQGITVVLTTFGVAITPEIAEYIIGAGLGIGGLFSIFFPEK